MATTEDERSGLDERSPDEAERLLRDMPLAEPPFDRSLAARALAAHRSRPYVLLWGLTALALVAYVALVLGPWDVGAWVHVLLVIAVSFALTGVMRTTWRNPARRAS